MFRCLCIWSKNFKKSNDCHLKQKQIYRTYNNDSDSLWKHMQIQVKKRKDQRIKILNFQLFFVALFERVKKQPKTKSYQQTNASNILNNRKERVRKGTYIMTANRFFKQPKWMDMNSISKYSQIRTTNRLVLYSITTSFTRQAEMG